MDSTSRGIADALTERTLGRLPSKADRFSRAAYVFQKQQACKATIGRDGPMEKADVGGVAVYVRQCQSDGMTPFNKLSLMRSKQEKSKTASIPVAGMDKHVAFSLFAVAVMIICSGCARLFLVEQQSPQRCPDVLYFAGTQAGVTASLGLFEKPGISGPVRSSMPATASLGLFEKPGIVLLPVVVPCELVADILFLPYDAARHIQYVSHPPLNELIMENDLKALSKRLASGEDPDAVDFRFFGRNGRNPCRPLMTAFAQGRLEAFNMLLDYGAEVPMEFFSSGRLNNMAFSPHGLDFLKAALKKGVAPEKLDSIDAGTVIPGMLSFMKNWQIDEEEKYHIVYSFLSILLENGFPPNAMMGRQTALDQLLEVSPSENRDKLVTLMRSYGAKTFAELDAMSLHVIMPPEINPQEMPDCFKPVIDILLQTGKDWKNGGHFRFSAAYPGIEGPVVVADVPVQNGYQSFYFRRFVNIHHRITPTQWDIQGQPFDIPGYLRIVLTPPGTRVPSRLSRDLPKKDVLLEEWHSLPTCELYIERPPYGDRSQTGIERVIRQVLALAGIPHDIHGKDYRSYFEHDPINRIGRLYYDNTINDSYNLDLKDKKKEYLFEVNANVLAKKTGLPGRWRVRTCGSRACFYSSHRDLPFLDRCLDHRVPYPDEIFAVVHTRPNPFLVMDSTHKKGQGDNVDYYWNCRIEGFPAKGNIVLYYGDEVSQEALDTIVEMARKLMKW